MECFVFRNNTIERFFPKGWTFSGYDDISFIPDDAESYVWFYQAPVNYNRSALAAEISGYSEKFGYVLGRLRQEKTVIALTMAPALTPALTDGGHEVEEAIASYNLKLYEACRSHPNLRVIDFSEFTGRFPDSDLMDWKFWFISQMGMNPQLTGAFKSWWEKKMDGIALKRRKCLVLDLDGTLWGGILGEDGMEGIQVGGDYPGKAFHYFQEALKELAATGVILTVCSKNNEGDVMEVWEKHPFLTLRKNDFAAWRINWNDKAEGIREIAAELNIGLDSMVFVDDNPAERELVRQALPMVAVPEFPEQPYCLPTFFEELVSRWFRVYSLTEEDRHKTEQNKANAARKQAQAGFEDFDKYIESLCIKLDIREADEFSIQRVAQMTQKTNQFNLTTKRYDESAIRQMGERGCRIFTLAVSDKFGDSGISGCAIVDGDEIDTLLLSCRVLGRKIEFNFISQILQMLKESGLDAVKASYVPTAKNGQTACFYEKCGFSLISEENGVKRYRINL